MFQFRMDSITFAGGTALNPPAAGLVVIVGPNGSGKTTALRELYRQVATHSPAEPFDIVEKVQVTMDGDAKDAVEWLRNTHVSQPGSAMDRVVAHRGNVLALQSLTQNWNPQTFRSDAAGFLVNMLEASDRLLMTTTARSIDFRSHVPDSYIHMLQLNDNLAAEMNRETRDLFGVDLIVNWGGGERVWLHVGHEPRRSVRFDRISAGYLSELEEQAPRLDNLGDGMRAYLGVMLALKSAAWPILLIDEPELFLHPPHARRIARKIARAAIDESRQIVVATHSADIIQGALAEGVDVAIVRLERQQDSTKASLLGVDDVRKLWRHPLLSSASAVDGLFHRGVVVCEADSDSRLYDAGVRQLERRGAVLDSPDLYYVSGAGKGSLATLADAYRKLHTPVAVIADLDLLNQAGLVKTVLSALGQDPKTTADLYHSVARALSEGGALLSAREVADGLSRVVERINRSGAVHGSDRREVEQLVLQALPWARAKRDGVDILSDDDARSAHELLATWRRGGLFVVPCGELECLWRETDAEGKLAWNNDALRHLAEGSVIPQLDELLTHVLRHFGIRLRTDEPGAALAAGSDVPDDPPALR